MKSKTPFAIKSPLRVQVYGGDTYEQPDTVITKTVGEQVGQAITGLADNATKYMDDYKKPEPREKVEIASSIKSDRGQVPERGFASAGDLRSETTINSTPSTSYSQGLSTLKKNPKKLSAWENEFGKATLGNFKEKADLYNKKNKSTTAKIKTTKIFGDNELLNTYSSSVGQMKGSPNKLIGDTMDPYGQPQRGNRDFTFNENEIAPGTLGSQASVGVQKEIFGGGQAQTAAEQLAAEQLQTPLLSKGHGVKQAHTHPSKTTTKMKPDGEYPGARYVKGDLVDQDDLLDKTELDAHIATQVQSDKKGTFIKEKPYDGPGSDIETSKGFGKKIRLESMGRSSYTSNMKDQLDPHDFLFKKTPKKSK